MTRRHHICIIHTHVNTKKKRKLSMTMSKLAVYRRPPAAISSCFCFNKQKKLTESKKSVVSKPFAATNKPSLVAFELTITAEVRNAMTGEQSDTACWSSHSNVRLTMLQCKKKKNLTTTKSLTNQWGGVQCSWGKVKKKVVRKKKQTSKDGTAHILQYSWKFRCPTWPNLLIPRRA